MIATRPLSSNTSPPAEYSRTTGSSCASSDANVVGPSAVRRRGIIAGVGALDVMIVRCCNCCSCCSCCSETDCDVYSSSSGSSGFWAWSSAAWASMRARSAGVIMIPTILNSVCRWGNGMLVNGKLVVLKGMA